MSIRPLPKDAVDKIKSSSAITSLNQVVCGLLTNSLDACSTKVNISLDYALGNCTVQDNGLDTSKIPPNPSTHGSHGNFLASVATFSLLTATSHHQRHTAQASISVHNGNIVARHVPALPDQRFVLFSHGTRVCVRNLFGSMAVRVKQRGLLFSDRSRVDRELESLLRAVAGLLLSWPIQVSILLRETNTQREQRLTSGNSDSVARISRIFTQAGLADSQDPGSWVSVSASCRRVRIKGAISTNPVATRRSQIMSLGIRPIPNNFGTNILYEEINKLFRSSSFGVAEADGQLDGVQGKPRKGIDRWPMFYLEVHLIGSGSELITEDVLGDSEHSLQAIIDLLKVVCYGFLKKHLLQPQRIQRIAEKPKTVEIRRPQRPLLGKIMSEAQQSSRPLSAVAAQSESGTSFVPFDGWKRFEVGRVSNKAKVAYEPVEGADMHAKSINSRIVDDNGAPLQRPLDDDENIERPVRSRSQNDSRADEGTLLRKNNANADEVKRIVSHSLSIPRLIPPVPRAQEGAAQAGPQEWLQDILGSWKNPVFEPTEPRIPSLDQDLPIERPVNVNHDGPSSKFYSHENNVQFEAAAMAFNGRLSRTALAKAEVIGQVDRKFLLLQLPLQTAKAVKRTERASLALIMLDQHAADERCRLEELMSQYFNGKSLRAATELLTKPIVFEPSARESELLSRLQNHFCSWGVVYKTSAENEHRVEIQSLPPSILERCRTEPKLAIDILRKEVWKLEDRNVPPRPVYEMGRPWVSSFHNCPQGILELLHSRSCRSAIMFNDELSKGECEHMVQRLSQCVFPFQCAHGRPSLVPLVDMGLGGRVGDWKASSLGVDKWKSWLGK
ncbi:DNA mismatch repair protein [Metarhizium rileyi]|uniref:DNA mismatch repair protein n=1 Tax=Metarhizium rileyi (strain RCEF 4871) TaxID=1649241 RepID=A0A166Z7Y9_METRR|nr:DNA mismatch repair protein [Metarhizium rileyi RCEF 4871]